MGLSKLLFLGLFWSFSQSFLCFEESGDTLLRTNEIILKSLKRLLNLGSLILLCYINSGNHVHFFFLSFWSWILFQIVAWNCKFLLGIFIIVIVSVSLHRLVTWRPIFRDVSNFRQQFSSFVQVLDVNRILFREKNKLTGPSLIQIWLRSFRLDKFQVVLRSSIWVLLLCNLFLHLNEVQILLLNTP